MIDFVWFSDADSEIVGEQICSLCRKDIPEDEVPLMLFRGKDKNCQVARFHHNCFKELLKVGILKLAAGNHDQPNP